jgi:hypothetical protein
LRDHFAQVVEFSGDGDNAPLPHLFLLKQLGRFKVPCSLQCDRSFASSAWAQHMTKTHTHHSEKKGPDQTAASDLQLLWRCLRRSSTTTPSVSI